MTKFPSWTSWVSSPSPAPIIKNLWDRLSESSAFFFSGQTIATLGKRKHDLRFISSANRAMRVVVFKRPFFLTYTTSWWARFLRFSRLSHKKIEEDLEKLGLTPPQFCVLATIGYASGLPFGEIGAKMMVTVSNLTGIVDRLEEKKLVSRKRDENDRRVVHVVLTEKGGKIYKTTIPLFEKSVSYLFSALDKPQQKDLSALLRKLNRVSWAK
jgi:DNA-binding MarR family transcriptional regulator